MTGRSSFVARVLDVATLKEILRAVEAHNAVAVTPLEEMYTLEEYEELDPIRGGMIREFVASRSVRLSNISNLHKFSRGDDIKPAGCFVDFDGDLWLEFTNSAGGACSTRWLRENAPAAGFWGTDRPRHGYDEAPDIDGGDTLEELLKVGLQLLEQPYGQRGRTVESRPAAKPVGC